MRAKTVMTELVCPECGNRQVIQRKANKAKPLGHRKWLYCWRCKKQVNFYEIGNNIVTEADK